jgi:CubicO group peptidase (beta-lactamase class C family)
MGTCSTTGAGRFARIALAVTAIGSLSACLLDLSSGEAPPRPPQRSNDASPPDPADAGEDGPSDEQKTPRTFDELTAAFFGPGNKQGTTDGIVVRHKDKIVYEHYGNGYTASNRHLLYSVSKSVTSLLIGIAVDEGLLKTSDSVCKYVHPAGADPTLCDTTVEDLLYMSPGLRWVESYGTNPAGNTAPMLYGSADDMADYAAQKPRVARPRTAFEYSTGTTSILSKVLRVALGSRDATDYAREKLFGPLGITSAIWEKDRSGTLVGGASLFMTPRDMTLIGQLMLDKGRSRAPTSLRVVSESWIDFSVKWGPTNMGYGAHWWVTGSAGRYPGSFRALGHLGQVIDVSPRAELVIVRVGNDRTSFYSSDVLRDGVYASLNLPTAPEQP